MRPPTIVCRELPRSCLWGGERINRVDDDRYRLKVIGRGSIIDRNKRRKPHHKRDGHTVAEHLSSAAIHGSRPRRRRETYTHVPVYVRAQTKSEWLFRFVIAHRSKQYVLLIRTRGITYRYYVIIKTYIRVYTYIHAYITYIHVHKTEMCRPCPYVGVMSAARLEIRR